MGTIHGRAAPEVINLRCRGERLRDGRGQTAQLGCWILRAPRKAIGTQKLKAMIEEIGALIPEEV